MSKWTWDKSTKRTKGSDRVCFNFHQHYNGSGPEAFGGVQEWPALSIDIEFPEGSEERRLKIAARIRDVLSNEGIINLKPPAVQSDRCYLCKGEARPGKITCKNCG